ncbi:MAG TPA: PilN domain-containing protein [Bacillota bacterium]|nr:PilN domain-containing protein [Bacillota bacterium]
MSSKANDTVCLSFNQNNVFITRNNPATRLAEDLTLNVDFPVLNDSGVVVQPQRLADCISDFFDSHNLPSRVQVALKLQYVDLRYLYFPVIPEDELVQIIRDEAIRESIFSYSGESIAVAYKPTGSKTMETGFTNTEVLVATTPQSVIDSIVETFNHTDLKLLSIQPNLEGLQLFYQQKLSGATPVIFLNLQKEEAEFYIWADQKVKFWRHLKVGSDQPERITTEVRLSLEHYQRRAAGEAALKLEKVYILGTTAPLDLEGNFQTEYPAGDSRVDLQGLAAQQLETIQFSFISLAEKNSAEHWLGLGKLWPYALVVLLGLNSWSLLHNHSQTSSVQQSRRELLQLQQNQEIMEKQLQQLQNVKINEAPTTVDRMNLELLLEDLRRIVPVDMRFEQMTINPANRQVQLEGFCLEPQSMNYFLKELKQLPRFKTFTLIDTHRDTRSQHTALVFRLEIELGAIQ